MATAKSKTKKSISKKTTAAKRRPRPKGTKVTPPSTDSKEARRQFTQVKRWLYGSKPHKPVSLVWRDDAELDWHEGRDGDDIRVVLTPHQDKLSPSQLKKMDPTRRGKCIPLVVKKPSKKSGLRIFDARIDGLPLLTPVGAVLYQIVAKDAEDAKKQLIDVVVKLRLQAVDVLLHSLSVQHSRPPEAILHKALAMYQSGSDCPRPGRRLVVMGTR